MTITCADCYTEINPENINISTDLAKCYACGSVQKVSELAYTLNREDLNPPHGSRMIFHKGLDGNTELTLPKRGFHAGLIPLLLFAIFWIGFISVWTIGAARGSIIFALFSLPFWGIGIMMIIGVINSINEEQIITINRKKLTVERKRPIRPRIFEADLKSIHSIGMKPMKMNLSTMVGNFNLAMKMNPASRIGNRRQKDRYDNFSIEMPAILTGMKTEFFLEAANDAEQEWATDVLNALVKKMK